MISKNIISIFIVIFCFAYVSVEATEEKLKLIGTDEKTGTSFNVIEKGEMIGSQCERGGFLGGLDVIGIVPDNVALEDDAVAKSLIEKGKDAALVACEFKLSSGELRIELYKGGYRKPEVSAKWKQVYSHEVEEALRKGPSEYYNSAFERFEKLKLAEERNKVGSDASRIIVTEVKLIDTNSSHPRYSPDGSKILYSKEETPKKNQPGRAFQSQIIKDVKTLRMIKTFGKAGTSRKGAWAPDSRRIAYFATPERGMGFIGVRGKLHIFDIASGKIVKLDYQEPDFIIWEEQNGIYFLETSALSYSSIYGHERRYTPSGTFLNLETLTKNKLSENVCLQFATLNHEGWWFETNKHKYNYIYRIDVKRGQPSLIVANTDNSYARVLIEGVFDQHPYIVSPDFTSIVYARGYALYIAYLGKRADPITKFKVQFSDASLKEKLEAALKNNVIVRGTVFGPRINPLNKKMVGPDEKIFKGNIEFTGSDGSDFIVRTTFEKVPFGSGDIVSEIYAEDRSIGREAFDYQPNLDVWAVLKAQMPK